MDSPRFENYQNTIHGQNLQFVLAFKAGPLLETYKSITFNETEFVYDVHKVKDGINVSVEILPWSIEPSNVSIIPHWLNPNVFLMPYSGFCFPLKSSNPNENYQPDAGQDDHLFYQGEEIRGIELLVFGNTKEEALDSAKKAFLEPEIQEMIKTVSKKTGSV